MPIQIYWLAQNAPLSFLVTQQYGVLPDQILAFECPLDAICSPTTRKIACKTNLSHRGPKAHCIHWFEPPVTKSTLWRLVTSGRLFLSRTFRWRADEDADHPLDGEDFHFERKLVGDLIENLGSLPEEWENHPLALIPKPDWGDENGGDRLIWHYVNTRAFKEEVEFHTHHLLTFFDVVSSEVFLLLLAG